jgi:hypothetical protein
MSATLALDQILQARRAGCRDALMGRGQSPEQAERWCDAWETHALLDRRDRSGEFWQDGLQWIEGRLAASN